MSYPTPNIHRPSRRKLTRGAANTALGISVYVSTHSTNVVRVSFNRPVILNGIPKALLNGIPPTGAVQSAPDTVDLTYAAAVSGQAFDLPANDPGLIDTRGQAFPEWSGNTP